MHYNFNFQTDYLLTLTQLHAFYTPSNKNYIRQIYHYYYNVTIFNCDFIISLPILRCRLKQVSISDFLVIYVTEHGKAPDVDHMTDKLGNGVKFIHMTVWGLIEHLGKKEVGYFDTTPNSRHYNHKVLYWFSDVNLDFLICSLKAYRLYLSRHRTSTRHINSAIQVHHQLYLLCIFNLKSDVLDSFIMGKIDRRSKHPAIKKSARLKDFRVDIDTVPKEKVLPNLGLRPIDCWNKKVSTQKRFVINTIAKRTYSTKIVNHNVLFEFNHDTDYFLSLSNLSDFKYPNKDVGKSINAQITVMSSNYKFCVLNIASACTRLGIKRLLVIIVVESFSYSESVWEGIKPHAYIEYTDTEFEIMYAPSNCLYSYIQTSPSGNRYKRKQCLFIIRGISWTSITIGFWRHLGAIITGGLSDHRHINLNLKQRHFSVLFAFFNLEYEFLYKNIIDEIDTGKYCCDPEVYKEIKEMNLKTKKLEYLENRKNTVKHLAIESAKNINIINEYDNSFDDNWGVFLRDDKYEAATKRVKEIESQISSSETEVYNAELSKHVKK